jgi:hypothetical protein
LHHLTWSTSTTATGFSSISTLTLAIREKRGGGKERGRTAKNEGTIKGAFYALIDEDGNEVSSDAREG